MLKDLAQFYGEKQLHRANEVLIVTCWNSNFFVMLLNYSLELLD